MEELHLSYENYDNVFKITARYKKYKKSFYYCSAKISDHSLCTIKEDMKLYDELEKCALFELCPELPRFDGITFYDSHYSNFNICCVNDKNYTIVINDGYELITNCGSCTLILTKSDNLRDIANYPEVDLTGYFNFNNDIKIALKD